MGKYKVEIQPTTEKDLSKYDLIKSFIVNVKASVLLLVLLLILVACTSSKTKDSSKKKFATSKVKIELKLLEIKRVDSKVFSIHGFLENIGQDSIKMLPSDNFNFVGYFQLSYYNNGVWSEWNNSVPVYYYQYPNYVYLMPKKKIYFSVNTNSYLFPKSDFDEIRLKFKYISKNDTIILVEKLESNFK